MRKERVLLKDGVDAALIGRKSVEPGAAHPDFTGSGLLESGDQSKQSGFAGRPLSPSKVRNSPAAISSERVFSTSRGPKRLLTARTSRQS